MARVTADAAVPSRRLGISLAVAVLLAASGPASAPPKAHASSCTLTGEGTEAAPFLVPDAAALALVGVAPCGLDAHYLQTDDISIPSVSSSTTNHTPIGTASAPFTGVYDGQFYSILPVRIFADGSDDVGLFGRMDGATIRNLQLSVRIEGSVRVGALAGSAYGSTIDSVNARGRVDGLSHVGGLIGETSGGTTATVVSESWTDFMRVEANGSRVGGLIGSAGGFIVDSYSSANVFGAATSSYVGGLVGYLTVGGEVNQSSAVGSVEGHTSVGGLVGQMIDSASIVSSGASGPVIGIGDPATSSGVGGLVGLAGSSTWIVGSVSGSGETLSGSASVGGLVGTVVGSASIETSWAWRDTSGAGFVGGLAGMMRDEGGVSPSISASFALGSVSASGAGPVGGLVGGMLEGGSIFDSFARASVSGASASSGLGGLVGRVSDGSASITNSFATGEVSGGTQRGGLVGEASGTGGEVVGTGSFWDRDTTGLTTSVGSGVSKATAEMKALATFTDIATVGLDVPWAIVAGWAAYDPSGSPARIWGLCSAVNDGYPFLLSRYESDPCGGSGPSVDPGDPPGSDDPSDTGGSSGSDDPSDTDGSSGSGGPADTDEPADTDDPSGSDDPSDTDRTPSTGSTGGDEGTAASATTSGGAAVVACGRLPLRVGANITCTIEGGPAHAEVLWRASFNPTIASAGVLLDGDGRGTFEFTVPASAVGSEVQVELVEWTRPLSLGAVEGPLPGAVPAGEGPGPTPRDQLLLTALLAATLLLRRRGSGAGWPEIRVSR